jgi:hypothetical protein
MMRETDVYSAHTLEGGHFLVTTLRVVFDCVHETRTKRVALVFGDINDCGKGGAPFTHFLTLSTCSEAYKVRFRDKEIVCILWDLIMYRKQRLQVCVGLLLDFLQ